MSIQGKDQATSVRNAMASAAEASQQNNNRERERDRERDEPRGGSRRDEGRRDTDSLYDRNTAGLTQIGRANPPPIPMSNTAEALEQFRREFSEAMPSKDENNPLVCAVHPIDASLATLPFSMITISGFKRNKPELGVAHHTFLLAASAEPLRPREESYRGGRVTLVQTAGEGYDDRARDIVIEELQRAYPGKDLFSADAETIFADFPSVKVDETAIVDCVKNAYAAIKNALDRADPETVVLSLKAEDSRESNNSIHIQHRQNHMFDRGHLPVRTDIVIDLVAQEQRSRNSRNVLDQMTAGTRVVRAGCFFDLVYSPTEAALARNDLYSRRRERSAGDEYQYYALRLIRTSLDTVDYSPQADLLSLAAMKAAADPHEIMRAFEPNMELGEDDTRNIGALAIEPNLSDDEIGFSKAIETKTNNFTQGKRQALLRATIRPGMIYSIDVPECGASTWQGLDYLGIVAGNQRSHDRVYDAACILTGGIFEDLYPRTAPIIDDHVERILLGYYTEGSSGQRLDLRDFDYLALLNMLRPEKEEDMRILQRWSMSAATSSDSIFEESDRYEIIRDFVPTHKITGHALRLNLNSDFHEALVEAVLRCKLPLNPQSSSRDQSQRYRTTYGNIDNVLSKPGNQGLYRNQRNRGYDRDDRYDRSDRNAGRFSSF